MCTHARHRLIRKTSRLAPSAAAKQLGVLLMRVCACTRVKKKCARMRVTGSFVKPAGLRRLPLQSSFVFYS